jgi:hypothetical protein
MAPPTAGAAQPVDGEAIAAAIASAGETVRVVVLNACFSADLARTLTRHVDVAVGMDRPVGDDAAREFAQAFYSALGYGSSVGRAFDQARAALMLAGIPEERTPQLAARDGIDPYELVLVDPAEVRVIDPETERRALADVTSIHLAHLERHSRLPIGDGLELTRAAGPMIARRAQTASLLVLGAPGSGKTGALYAFARDARAAGHDVVVLAADLLEASGRRSLSEELGLELELVDALAAWPGDEPGYLVIDALDASRGRESASVLLEVIERVAARAGRWRVAASVRSFDLRHNRALQAAFPRRGGDTGTGTDLLDPEFLRVSHVSVGALSEEELGEFERHAPAVAEFLANARPAVRELAHVPFNLRLLVLLLQREDVNRSQLGSLGTQLELLDLYWESRVVGESFGSDARELFAQRVCEEAVAGMRLQVPRARLRSEAAQGSALDELLAEGVLIEAPGASRRPRDTVGFSHHVLFDFAVHRLLLSGTPDEIAARLTASEQLVLLARPSLVLTLAAEWAADPSRRTFWTLALRLTESEVPGAARIVAPTVAADEARSLADFLPLLEAIDQRSTQAPFLLSHTVGARTALGVPSHPLAGRDDLSLWSDLARALSARVSWEIAYPMRLLVWGLWAEYDRLTDDERLALGAAARALLQWAWSQRQPPATEVGVALDAVARSCATDPQATRALLLQVADPNRIPQFGSYELTRLADELGPLAECVPDVVEHLYEAAYSYDEDSQARTQFGSSQILRMTSTKAQDWQMVHYGIAQAYSRVLQTNVRTAVRVLAYACTHETARSAHGRRAGNFVIGLGDTIATVIHDLSEYWDTGSHHRDVSTMLAAFEDVVAEAAASGDRDTIATVFDVLAERPQPAAIWRHLVRAAAREPTGLASYMAGPLASPAFLDASELLEPVGVLLPLMFEYVPKEDRVRIEDAILALPDCYPSDRRERGERRRDQLLGALPAELLTREPARDRSAVLRATGTAPPPTPAFDVEVTRREVTDAEIYRERGIDPDAPANERLLAAIVPVSEFARAHSNAAPSAEAVAIAVPQIDALRAALAEASSDISRPLFEEAQSWLCEAAAGLAWQTPLPVEQHSVKLARDLAVEGARAVIPYQDPEDLEQFDDGFPMWSVPAGRIDAARALLFLCRDPAAIDAEVLERIAELARDTHPAVRWTVAHWAGLAGKSDEDWTWTLIEKIAAQERSAQVLQALVHSVNRLTSDDPERAAKTVRGMYDREAAGARRESLLRALAQYLIELWIWRGVRQGRALVDEWAAHIERDAALARVVPTALRAPVTHGGDSEADTAVRWRAIGVWADLTRAAGEAFHDFEDRRRGSETLKDDEEQRLRDVAQLLDASASELYFASGAYAETGQSNRARLSPNVRERFYREAESVFEVLASVGLPSIAHHVLQTLASYAEFDPRGVLLRLGLVLDAGRTWGYQLESLAESEFVALVERYLASHRDLLARDRAAREVLVHALESFIDAGWPSARRLMYGLDDIFR